MAPVSGSKNTKREGIKVIMPTLKINLNSSFLLWIGNLLIKLAKYSESVNFTSSLGWKDKDPIVNHALAPWIFLPKIKTKTSKRQENK